MQLKQHHREYLVRIIRERFSLSVDRAAEMVDDFQRFMLHGDQKFIYDLHYAIFLRKDPNFTHRVLSSLVKDFVYLYKEAQNDDERENINKHFSMIFDVLFIQRCTYAKKLEERAKTAQNILINVSNRLNEVLETQELMIANISHEMRTSLNAIYGYLTLVENSNALQGEEKYYLQKANHATLTLKSLVKDILNVTKLNSGQLEIQKEFFWIDEMILKCIDNLSMEMKKKEKVSFHLDVDFMPFKVYGDQVHIMEIVINLLSNAFKYTEKGTIDLSMKYRQEKQGVYVTFSVKDSGIGMTEEQVEKIFNPYSRFKTEKQGLGLGLHITKQLSERLNGKLKVESELGRGSTFSFSLFFERIKPTRMDVEGKQICLFMDEEYKQSMQGRLEFLKEHGAVLHEFDDETQFINHLLSLKTDAPELILISTNREGYTKFDALSMYLKTTKLFNNTLFIAENTYQHTSLRYFDEIFEYFAPVRIYEKLLVKKISPFSDSKIDISILVIDDTETNLDIFKLFISKRYPNIIVDLANGGYEGIGMFKIKQYDIVFLDLKMPGLSGFEVLKKLEKIGPLPPIYAFSADVYKSNFEKVQEYGFAGLLEKPLQPSSLFKIVQKVIDAKNHR